MKYLFLLGGHDLEMVEIRNILDENNIEYIDKNLSWGAKLSDYIASYDIEIKLNDKNTTLVSVELTNDSNMEIENLIEIDHHNEKADFPAAIEQVAKLLNIKLTREQLLIAENDKGYIPKMIEFGATKEEIAEIRKLDRMMQGVTDEDEKLAVESIKDKKTIDGIILVESKTSKFSPVVDRLYPFEKLLIYTENNLTYYGKHAKLLGKKYSEILNDKVYFGGQGEGYFGISGEKITEQLLNDIISKINEKN
ncbi:conserved hypothetical protein [Methanococcus vannielii SB]|uniref:Uncharacterized protein n=1 Tax=Methanococcus vannielii (strain ATCC 35089 / DSM 1224 / JCM 13029 / OCM 148 / SB) TaxID=406327 RepID=A6UNF3_METVS|nr:hypothetical protein [Methanococcus vannielii]ABR54025.1 conserved hypothetical protein [Methanococcus vannielii SB]